MTKTRKPGRGVTGGGAYKKGATFKVHTRKPHTDTVYPGDIRNVPEFKQQYQIMLGLKVEAQKQLRASQAIARKLEKRENLLLLAQSVDKAVSTLEDAVGTLHRMLHLLGEFASKPVRVAAPDRYPEAE